MIKKNQTIKGVTFANLSYGADSHVQLGDVKLTLPQSEIYLNANNYKSVVFIGGRGAGKSFLANKFLEDYLQRDKVVTISSFNKYEYSTHLLFNRFRTYTYLKFADIDSLRGLGFKYETVVHIEEPFAQPTKFVAELLNFSRFFVECTVPQLDLNNDLHRWFIDLVSKESTLSVIAATSTNQTNMQPWYLAQFAGNKHPHDSAILDGI